MAASALAYFEPASGKALRTSVTGDDDDGCRVGLRDTYRDDVRAFASLYSALDHANTTQGSALGDLPEAGQRLLLSVAPKTFKKPRDETRLSHAIQEYQYQAAELDRTGYTDYGIAWIKARYHACAWEYRTSLDHYNMAVDLAMHRAGGTVLRKIVDEAAALAAHVGDRVAAKNLIDLRVAAGLTEPPDGSTRDPSVADDEIDKLRGEFYFKFPRQGLFQSVDAEAWAESVGLGAPL